MSRVYEYFIAMQEREEKLTDFQEYVQNGAWPTYQEAKEYLEVLREDPSIAYADGQKTEKLRSVEPSGRELRHWLRKIDRMVSLEKELALAPKYVRDLYHVMSKRFLCKEPADLDKE